MNNSIEHKTTVGALHVTWSGGVPTWEADDPAPPSGGGWKLAATATGEFVDGYAPIIRDWVRDTRPKVSRVPI